MDLVVQLVALKGAELKRKEKETDISRPGTS
jgi:hypothetical protein